MASLARFEGKTLLISGATGIAAATAEEAALEGAQVFLVSLSASEGDALVAQLGTKRAAHLAGDLTRADVADEAVRLCQARFGRIDGLFNVAGISGRRFGDGPVHECSDEGWDLTMAANARSSFLLSRAVLRAMLQQSPDPKSGQRGNILNMGSVLALSPEPRNFATHAYAASKGALLALTTTMAAAYAPQKIRVNVVSPSLVRTPMSLRAQDNPDIVELMRRKHPLAGDLLPAAAVARAALFLLSDDAAFVTGQNLVVDAGWQLSPV